MLAALSLFSLMVVVNADLVSSASEEHQVVYDHDDFTARGPSGDWEGKYDYTLESRFAFTVTHEEHSNRTQFLEKLHHFTRDQNLQLRALIVNLKQGGTDIAEIRRQNEHETIMLEEEQIPRKRRLTLDQSQQTQPKAAEHSGASGATITSEDTKTVRNPPVQEQPLPASAKIDIVMNLRTVVENWNYFNTDNAPKSGEFAFDFNKHDGVRKWKLPEYPPFTLAEAEEITGEFVVAIQRKSGVLQYFWISGGKKEFVTQIQITDDTRTRGLVITNYTREGTHSVRYLVHGGRRDHDYLCVLSYRIDC